ncbi:hypothetical protein [Radiobacillus sp. PE A8.2]|uniref:hypothetical protein n=1 Tax=Radiobacillus sp. PE A8.2 TaxID=3380349 RepID=UPI00388D78FB
MGSREYKLKDTEERLSEQDKQLLEEAMERLTRQFNLSNSEAAYAGRIIFLPHDQKIDPPSNLRIKTYPKTKIDYIAKLKEKEIQEWMRNYQEENKLKQASLRKITNQFNRIVRDVSEEDKAVENFIKLLEHTTESVVNEKQVSEYVNKIVQRCDKLIDCLFLENPEILDSGSRDEVF